MTAKQTRRKDDPIKVFWSTSRRRDGSVKHEEALSRRAHEWKRRAEQEQQQHELHSFPTCVAEQRWPWSSGGSGAPGKAKGAAGGEIRRRRAATNTIIYFTLQGPNWRSFFLFCKITFVHDVPHLFLD
jgi:hypothetical protein